MLFASVRDLELRIDEFEAEILTLEVSPEFTRKTTIVRLRGAGHEGVGEDVTYNPDEHDAERFPRLDLTGDWTLATFSAYLDGVDLFPAGEPDQPAYHDYRRWAFESAALDLALRQAGRSLAEQVDRPWRPVTFVSSGRATGLDDWLALYPDRFASSWMRRTTGRMR